MSTFIEEVESGVKRAAAFITGRGMTATAVAAASPFIGQAQLPIVGLAVGLPVTAAVSTMQHYEKEDKILKNFQAEIAAYFGIESEEVTHDHLRSLAFGNEKIGVKAQPFFQEILEKNDKNRWIDITANLFAAGVGIAFVALKGSAILSSITGFAETSAIGLLAANPAVAGFIGLSLAAGVLVHAVDYVCSNLGKDILADRGNTAYEMVEHFAKQKQRGIAISEDKVMDLFTKIDKGLNHEIVTDYGASYHVLPNAKRAEVLAKYKIALDLEEITDKVNAGTLKLNELAFIGAGMRSGVPERTPEEVAALETPSSTGFGQKLQQFRAHFQGKEQAGHAAIPPHIIGGSVQSIPASVASQPPVSVAKINDMPHETGFAAEAAKASTPVSVNNAIEISTDIPTTLLESGANRTASISAALQQEMNAPRILH